MISRVVQAVFGDVPTELIPYIESVREAFKKYPYQMFQLLPIDDPKKRCNESDILRFQLANEDPYIVWIDLDVRVWRVPDFNEVGKPYFAFRRGQPRSFFFYLNGCHEFIDQMFDDLDRMRISTQTYCWPAKGLRNKDVFQIPDDCYEHLAFSASTIFNSHVGG